MVCEGGGDEGHKREVNKLCFTPTEREREEKINFHAELYWMKNEQALSLCSLIKNHGREAPLRVKHCGSRSGSFKDINQQRSRISSGDVKAVFGGKFEKVGVRQAKKITTARRAIKRRKITRKV